MNSSTNKIFPAEGLKHISSVTKLVFSLLAFICLICIVLAIFLDTTGKNPPEKQVFDNLAPTQQKFVAQYVAGIFYEQQNQFDKAEAVLEQAVLAEHPEIREAAQKQLTYLYERDDDFFLKYAGILKKFWWLPVLGLGLLIFGFSFLVYKAQPKKVCTVSAFSVFPPSDSFGSGLHLLIKERLQNIKNNLSFRGNTGFMQVDQQLELPLFNIFTAKDTRLASLAILDDLEIAGLKLPLGASISFLLNFFKRKSQYNISGTIHKLDDTYYVNVSVTGARGELLYNWQLFSDEKHRSGFISFDAAYFTEEQFAEEIALLTIYNLYKDKHKLNSSASLGNLIKALNQINISKNGLFNYEAYQNTINLLAKVNDLEPSSALGHFASGMAHNIAADLNLFESNKPSKTSAGDHYAHARDEFEKVSLFDPDLKLEADYNKGLSYFNEFQFAGTDTVKLEKAWEIFSGLEPLGEKDKTSPDIKALVYCGMAITLATLVANPQIAQKYISLKTNIENYCNDALTLKPYDKQIKTWVSFARGNYYRSFTSGENVTLSQEMNRKAVVEYKKIIESASDYLPVYPPLANSYNYLHEYNSTVNLLEKLHESKRNREIWHALGRAYAQLFIKTLNDAPNLQVAGKDPDFFYNKSLENFGKNAEKGSFEALNEIGDLKIRKWNRDSNNTQLLDEALACYEKSMKRRDDHPRAGRSFAYWSLEKLSLTTPGFNLANTVHKPEIESLIKLAERVSKFKLSPTTEIYQWLILDVLGWVKLHFSKKQRVAAKIILLASLKDKYGGNHISNLYHLAYANRLDEQFVAALEYINIIKKLGYTDDGHETKAYWQESVEVLEVELINDQGDAKVKDWILNQSNTSLLIEAMAYYFTAYKLNPHYARTNRNLAYWQIEIGLVTHNSNPSNGMSDKTIEQINEYAELAVQNLAKSSKEDYWQILDVSGWVLLHSSDDTNQHEKAIKHLKKSLEEPRGEKHLKNLYHLAYAYKLSGKLKEAKEVIEEISQKRYSIDDGIEPGSYWEEKIKLISKEVGITGHSI